MGALRVGTDLARSEFFVQALSEDGQSLRHVMTMLVYRNQWHMLSKLQASEL